MKSQITQSSTFPDLPSLAVQQPNGLVSVSVAQKSTKRRIPSLKCLTISCLFIILLAITNLFTYFLTKNGSKTIDLPIQNLSVKKGEEFRIVYVNDEHIKQCSISHPSFKATSHKLEYPLTKNVSSIDNGRININVSQRWCQLAVKHALPTDDGPWEFLVQPNDVNYNHKYKLYNVSVNEDMIFIPSTENNETHEKKITKLATTVETKLAFSPNTTINNLLLNFNTSLIRTLAKTTAYVFCPSNWIMFGNDCYKLFHQSIFLERNEAAKICRKQKSSLSSIHSIQEQTFISEYVKRQEPGKKVWVGGKRVQSDWKWDDGSSFGYTNWYGNEPDSEEDCMYLHYSKTYQWQDANCGVEGKRWAISMFLCKKWTL